MEGIQFTCKDLNNRKVMSSENNQWRGDGSYYYPSEVGYFSIKACPKDLLKKNTILFLVP